ncbi:DUF3078 domain-containing protein [Alistipes sp.]|uniref:DUF3078 domain-containing protein n=1 Tax=Alistipes sp. TaxID=1872444 RepID=UPI000ED69894|nr:DUF3078 domain-containing protein [Alistipes sp.]HCN13234.1 DUF3078 domain-containing protein [Alistipes sp.]
MKHLSRILASAGASLFCLGASAQISVDKVDVQQDQVKFEDRMRSVEIGSDYFSPARYRAERAAIRKERNFLEFGGGLQGALTAYNDPWVDVSGGDNSIALVGSLFLHHTFTKNLFTVETKFDAKLAYNRMKVEYEDGGEQGIWFKNQDEFAVSIAPSFKMSKNWSYGAIFKFRSQFVNGYKSRTEQEEEHMKSKFMSPGYLDLSFGITYKSPSAKFPIQVNMSPVAMSATFVESDLIRRDNGFSYGIEDPSKTSKYEGGSSIQIDFDRTFGKSGVLRYRTTLYSFFGWISDIGQKNRISDYSEYLDAYEKWQDANDTTVGHEITDKPRLPIHPTVRWENTIDIKATKYLSTTLSFQLYYNRAQNVSVQTRTLLSVGLSYTFKNK